MSALVARDSLNLIQSGTVLLAVHGALFGYFLTEIGIYFVRFPKDRIGFRIFVYWLTAAQFVYLGVKIGGFVTTINRVLDNLAIPADRLWLTFAPVLVTVCMEASAEGFFCWRLCAVSNKLWMKTIAVLLWTFSTMSHIIWVSMLGAAWQLTRPDVPDPPRLRILLLMSFWGTATENIWISSCLIYELGLSRSRQALKKSSPTSTNSGNISALVSLAMRTSAILIVFELLVAIVVSVGNQDETALAIETNFATAIYTVLSSIVVLHTLNYRTKIREASPIFSSPIFFTPTTKESHSSSSAGGGGGTGGGTSGGTRSSGTRNGTVSGSEGTGRTREGEGMESDGIVPMSEGFETNPRGQGIPTEGPVVKEEETRTKSGGNKEWKAEKKRETTRSSRGKKQQPPRPEFGTESSGSGIGVTVQTVSWVMEEERGVEGGQLNQDKVGMVIERRNKDPTSRPHRLRS
ncbi:hypothetical protein JCM16303_005266 [Sporobolomyces ruberrimus]